MKYLILVLLWVFWCALHSLLISTPITGYLKRRSREGYRYYRLTFNIVSVITLVPVVLYSMSISGPPIVRYEGAGRIYQVLLFLIAHVFFIAGAKVYDIPQFLGFRQTRHDNTCSVLTEDCSLDTSGILGVVRHPWYTGGMIIIWARNLDMAGLVTNLVLTLYFLIGTYLEERKLVAQFGQEYTDYQQRVSMFIPLKWTSKAFRGIFSGKKP
ncbi:hypothetical protein D3OALGA1CA_4260 [Olavius algarvensis associated proteobacterium Delta 3]|nr:hypothetical protein D3OALGB2SA_70 [Olavius algarvensis associated proteobacterium Delta 3]CAB5148065.1 hypothetical protein D3OALGA1CA_4260 [Olavius algarvensis associated proteobacterium Delta 3]